MLTVVPSGGLNRTSAASTARAYLFNMVVNIDTGEPSERNMTTGRHIVWDIMLPAM